MTTFTVVDAQGNTPSSDPKLDAYKYAAMLVNCMGRRYSMTMHADGRVSVASDGIETLTFCPEAR